MDLVASDDGLLQPCRPTFSGAKGLKRSAQIVLGLGPNKRHKLASPFL
jgi:hypothetical protein